jgi:hypothetical protein
MKKLGDYVAVVVIPEPKDNSKLQIINAGKINLYLHKYEVGEQTETFSNPVLLTVNAISMIFIPIKIAKIGKQPIKLYLEDEFHRKYLSTGEIIVQPFEETKLITPLEQSSEQQPVTKTKVFINTLSYKTERFDWQL